MLRPDILLLKMRFKAYIRFFELGPGGPGGNSKFLTRLCCQNIKISLFRIQGQSCKKWVAKLPPDHESSAYPTRLKTAATSRMRLATYESRLQLSWNLAASTLLPTHFSLPGHLSHSRMSVPWVEAVLVPRCPPDATNGSWVLLLLGASVEKSRPRQGLNLQPPDHRDQEVEGSSPGDTSPVLIPLDWRQRH